jgi:hypothetical protein
MSDNYFDAKPYKFEFTSEEVTKLVSAVIVAQVDDESFIKQYSEENPELCAKLQNNLRVYAELLKKLRHPA